MAAGGARGYRPMLVNLISAVVRAPTQIREELVRSDRRDRPHLT
jgi:hypothetical protein